jgi:hypothetical protein
MENKAPFFDPLEASNGTDIIQILDFGRVSQATRNETS